MLKAYKYRIYPNKDQSVMIEKTFGVCRLVYNLALETKIRAWQSAGINLSAYDLMRQGTELKGDYHWIGEVDSQAVQAAILNMDAAYKNFFKGSGFPKFKKKSGKQSFTCRNNTRKVDFINSTITIPKIPDIKVVISKVFVGQIKIITISRTVTGKYFASILVKTDQDEVLPPKPDKAVGIDLGLSHFATLSTGRKVDNPRFLRQNIERLQILQRRAAKKVKGSNNHKKALHRVAVVHERITNKRQDFLQKLSTEMIRDNQTDTICVESLAVKNMVKNRYLSQAISDVSWSEFVHQLEYKGKWYGKNIIKIDRFFASSKTCSNCGHKVESLPLSVREWICSQCHATHDRDVNAAINIKFRGLQTPEGIRGEPVEQSALMGCDEAGKKMSK